jgi:hypothetical protein
MGFGEGLVTGLATGFDKMMQLDMQRNMDRLSRAETYALTRRGQMISAAEKKGSKLKDNLRELAALTGSHNRAAMAAEGVGGTNAAIEELITDLKENRKKLGADFKIDKFIDFKGEDSLKDPRTLVDNFNRFKPEFDFSTNIPEGMGKATGIMGKLGMSIKRDIAEDVESTIPIDAEYTSPRDTSTIPSATIKYDEGYEALEFSAKYDKNKDQEFKTTENILAYGQELMLKNEEGTDAYVQGKAYYDMAQATLKEKKQKENADNATALTPSTGIKILNQVKNSMYDAEFTQSVGEQLMAKLSGTDSYKSYFAAQPSVLDEIQKTTTAYNNDATLQNFLRVEQRAYSTNTQTYINKFSQRNVPENKAFKFNDKGEITDTNPAIEPSATMDAQGKPIFNIGDISMVKYYDPQNNTYVGDTAAVWMGNSWTYME